MRFRTFPGGDFGQFPKDVIEFVRKMARNSGKNVAMVIHPARVGCSPGTLLGVLDCLVLLSGYNFCPQRYTLLGFLCGINIMVKTFLITHYSRRTEFRRIFVYFDVMR